jgi:ABC-type proline/glycine betaine transport system ATPase subunit
MADPQKPLYALEMRIMLNTDDPEEAQKRAERLVAFIETEMQQFDGRWVSSETYSY